MNDRVLVLAPDADDYLPFLEEIRREGVEITAFRDAESAIGARGGQEIVLGQPDLVAQLLDRCPGIRWVQSTWAGVTPLVAEGRRDYLLTGIRGVFGGEMAEYVLAYLLAHELRLLERLGRQAGRSWWPEPSGTLAGKTAGILGTGSIGREIARRLAAFDVTVLGLNRCGEPANGFRRTYGADSLEAFLSQPDYVVSVLPDTAETRGMLGAREIAAMRPEAYFVNVGRGSVLDESALAEALNDHRLAGAALDVFREEPLPQDSPLWHAENTLVTAHVAARSWPNAITDVFLENFRRFRDGRPLDHIVDFERGY